MTFYYTATKGGKPFATGTVTAKDEVQAMHLVKATLAGIAKVEILGTVRVHLKSPEQPLVDHFFNYRREVRA